MGWRIVKQPNGLYARFSDIVDDFTDMSMTEEEALAECRTYLGVVEAGQKVLAGIQDWKPRTTTPGSGTDRWDESVGIIGEIHGGERLAEVIAIGNEKEKQV